MEYSKGKNAQNLRSENRGLLFHHLCTRESTSRVELTQLSGLTKMTITNIVSEFLTQGYVVEEASKNAGTRNNPIGLRLSPDAPKVVAVLIRHTYINVALCDFHLDILALESVRISNCTRESVIQTALELTGHMISRANVVGIGIGSIGPVDIHRGVILNPPYFYGIHDIPMRDIFEENFHLPVYLDHHYNCTALAEKYYGAGKPYSNCIYLGMSNGLNVGIICNNQLLSSFTGYASEFGPVFSSYAHQLDQDVTPEHMFELFRKDTPEENRQQATVLSSALAGLCNILNPQAIIVDNSYGACSDDLLDFLSKDLNEQIALHQYNHIDVLKSYRADNFETASCAISVIHKVFSGHLMF